MERPEYYDPEDLEHLMLERSFDELLEEERAYALRHLADRAEYERMRALLHHVRMNDRSTSPMDASPNVREHVLQAFRDQRQPQWRIWLNSMGGFLFPEQPSHFWRPALALGMVAILSFTGVELWKSVQSDGNPTLAEVKLVHGTNEEKDRQKTPPAPTPSTAIAPTEANEAAPLGSIQSNELRKTESDQQSFGGVVEEVAKEKADAPPTVPAQYDLTDHADDQRERLAKAEQQVATDAVLEKTPSEENAAKDFSSRPSAAAAVETLATRRAEANHNTDAKNEAEKKAVMVTSPKEDELLGLLRAAW